MIRKIFISDDDDDVLAYNRLEFFVNINNVLHIQIGRDYPDLHYATLSKDDVKEMIDELKKCYEEM